ncbi:MAG: diadenylate cyclase CdaA [Clostridia bacterium]|nr:diadenylate cyclase CdaA [Clostridia bacterium]MBO4429129.1 diadenylate cyclase CdaA [Clostridia bacterium]
MKYIFGQFRGFADILDIILVAVLIFFVINFMRSRRASRVALGVFFVVAVIFIFSLFDLRALNFLFSNILQIGIIALVIIFQPEIRSAFEKIGTAPLSKFLGDQSSQASKHEILSNICRAASELSQEYTGALIVIERSTQLGDIIRTGTVVNADVEVALIKNIFYNKAPLHDGAMIIKSGRICAAGCILPLSTQDDIIKDLGTRHRAAIGMSENSDAIVIVVSEETGTISIAVDGQLRRNYDYNTLKNELSYLLRDSAGKKSKREVER